VGCCFQQKTCNISETGQDRTKVTTDDQQEVAYALSPGAKIKRPSTILACFETSASFGADHENLNEEDPYYWRRDEYVAND